jgi:hypothetical protein
MDYNPRTEPFTYSVTVTTSPGEPWSITGPLHNDGSPITFTSEDEATFAARETLPFLNSGDIVTVKASHPFLDFTVGTFTR